MGSLGIILAIILCAWVYAALHEANRDNRGSLGTIFITMTLLVGAIAFGIAGACT